MAPILSAQRDAIADFCRRFGVERLEVFGSATGSRFDPERSDVDFLAAFQPSAIGLSNYLGLAEALEGLLGRRVDLVIEHSVRNPYLRQSIDATRQLLYAHGKQEALV